jgi:alpha-galactosidase
VRHKVRSTRFYRHGWQSWSPTGWVDLSKRPEAPNPPIRRVQAEDPAYAGSPIHGGSGVGALELSEREVMLLGALGIGARVEADGRTLRGFYEAGTGDWFLARGEENAVFGRYAQLLHERLGGRNTGIPPRVWCSWYSYYQGISEALLAETLESLRGFPFDVFQVDDGWQSDVGDWEPNERFPSGMEWMAERIKAAGFIPGLWLAPFIVRPSSRLFRERPEWILRGDDGEAVIAAVNWGNVVYAIDVTHPEVDGWLCDLFSKVWHWGFRYLKLDFLYAAALPAVRRRDLRRELVYRQAMRRIREVVPEAYLLACGAPIFASLGIVDALRIGPDSAPYWEPVAGDRSVPAARNAIRTVLHRLWLKPVVHLDPDVVYFRSRRVELTEEQRQLLRDLALLTGYKGTSDPVGWLKETERQVLRDFLLARPEISQVGRYRFRLDGREVDFSLVVD